MSVYYDIHEHLVIEDTEKHDVELCNLHYRLSLMAAWVLQRRGGMRNLTIIADGQKFSFMGDILNARYQEALDVLCKARSVEVISDFGCYTKAMEVSPTPFELMAYLDEEIKENPEYIDGLFYCVYNNADCGDGAGIVCAYGKKNGVLYTGAVPFVETKQIPDGNWYAPQTAIACEVDAKEGRDMAAIEDVCRRLCRFSQETFTKDDEEALSRLEENYGITSQQLSVSENSIALYTNFLRVKNDDELKEVIRLYAMLIDLTDGECGLIGELVDVSGSDVRVVHFDVEASGEYTIEIAAVAE